jgi:wyosine [tRNA(Phe)-imidazoG37] synthetase (radical SAM superfamily)
MKHVFGPVPSRRLGFSLGVDPVVPKTCTMDCVYCELGPTTDRTVSRCPYVDADEILAELEARLTEGPELDFVTFSGSGEPSLSSEIGRLIREAKRLSSVPVAVLTNGSLLGDPDVREALSEASVVVPSLDAVSPRAFEMVNRPHPSLDPAAIVQGLVDFTAGFAGEVWLETLIVQGMNDDYGEIERIAEAVRAIAPDRVQLNTVVRPPADASARPVSNKRLKEIAARLSPAAEVIAPPSVRAAIDEQPSAVERIIEMASRRPVTVEDVARFDGTSLASAAKILDSMVREGLLELVRQGQTLYYRTYLDRERP